MGRTKREFKRIYRTVGGERVGKVKSTPRKEINFKRGKSEKQWEGKFKVCGEKLEFPKKW